MAQPRKRKDDGSLSFHLQAIQNGTRRFENVFQSVARMILADEIYSRLLYDGEEHVSLLEFEGIRDRVILLDGWSKTYAMTGWRLGFAVWPKPLVEAATRLAINCHSCVNAAGAMQ